MFSRSKSSPDIIFGNPLIKAPPDAVCARALAGLLLRELRLLLLGVGVREGVLDPPEYDPFDNRSSLVVFDCKRSALLFLLELKGTLLWTCGEGV